MIISPSLSAWKSCCFVLKPFCDAPKVALQVRIFQLGKFKFDTQKQQLMDGEKVIKLTTKESELLKLLCNNANKVLERNFALKNHLG
jgi:DNA-binding response OmpR family regulator